MQTLNFATIQSAQQTLTETGRAIARARTALQAATALHEVNCTTTPLPSEAQRATTYAGVRKARKGVEDAILANIAARRTIAAVRRTLGAD
jgi:hypothetical protein